jgi:hypothetical protein
VTSLFKTLSIGAAALAFAAMCDASAGVNATEAASQTTPSKHQIRKATNTARRHDRRHGYAVARHDDGYYEDRPVYYRPYPYQLPAPFFLGFAFAPPW